VIVRLRYHQPTHAYAERRTAEGLSKRDIIRCLKRYLARELLPQIREALGEPDPKSLQIVA
jgi:transposase